MPSYPTIDYLPDLTASEKANAGGLTFSPSSSNSVGWDNTAQASGSESYAILHSLYHFDAIAGATYDFASVSYFDPYILLVYDNLGNVILANSESDDPADFYLSDGYYGVDSIYDWIAPYTGTYYVDASWHQGSYYKFYFLSINEDVDTQPPVVPVDTTAPLLSSLSPTDNATSVAISDNLVLNFNETIQAGTGNIIIYSANGSVAKTIAVTDSSQVSISNSTVTINPSTDLTAGSNYYVNIDAGVVKDLAGNSFAGITDTTTYNFTTQSVVVNPPVSKLNDFIVLQQSSPAVVGAGEGNDTYLISGSMLSAGQSVTISDAVGTNSVQLVNGLAIASSKVASNALQLTLTNGAIININGANAFTYDVGGNSTAGIDNIDISFASFTQSILGVTVPGSGIANGGALVIGEVGALSIQLSGVSSLVASDFML